jgi:hypothetical protein
MKSQCKAERNEDDDKIKNINETKVFALAFVSMRQKLFFVNKCKQKPQCNLDK